MTELDNLFKDEKLRNEVLRNIDNNEIILYQFKNNKKLIDIFTNLGNEYDTFSLIKIIKDKILQFMIDEYLDTTEYGYECDDEFDEYEDVEYESDSEFKKEIESKYNLPPYNFENDYDESEYSYDESEYSYDNSESDDSESIGTINDILDDNYNVCLCRNCKKQNIEILRNFCLKLYPCKKKSIEKFNLKIECECFDCLPLDIIKNKDSTNINNDDSTHIQSDNEFFY